MNLNKYLENPGKEVINKLVIEPSGFVGNCIDYDEGVYTVKIKDSDMVCYCDQIAIPESVEAVEKALATGYLKDGKYLPEGNFGATILPSSPADL